MAFEMLVGMHVTDDDAYQDYRNGITPILDRHGGGFGYDFRVSEVLRSESDAPINRVFTIRFPSEAVMEDFFANEQYLAVKERHFVGAVSDTTIIATYDRADP